MLRPSKTCGLVLAFMIGMASAPASADSILVDFTWATTLNGQGYDGSFSGSGAFTFDDAGTTGVGFEEIGQWPNPAGSLLSLNLGGLNPVGSTTFDSTNSGVAGIFLFNGALDSFVVYGLIDGAGLTGNANDFMFQFQLANGVQNPLPRNTYNVSVATIAGAATSISGSFTTLTRTVPEPSTMLLLGMGIAGLVVAWKR